MGLLGHCNSLVFLQSKKHIKRNYINNIIGCETDAQFKPVLEPIPIKDGYSAYHNYMDSRFSRFAENP